MIFIVSALAKIASADSFELYLFSFKILPLGATFVLARLIIASELALGIWMALNCDPKWSTFAALAMLVGFTIFLIILAILGNKENCHCFGDLVDFSPTQSIIKNAVLIAMLLFSIGGKPFNIKWKPLWRSLIAIGSFAAVFIITPPDNWRYDNFKDNGAFNENAFENAVNNNIIPPEILEGEKVFCFYSMSCEFCHLSAKKLAVMRQTGEFRSTEIICIIGRNADDLGGHSYSELITLPDKGIYSSTSPSEFFKDTGLDCSKWIFIESSDFLRITNGSMPLTVIWENGNPIAKYGYRDMKPEK